MPELSDLPNEDVLERWLFGDLYRIWAHGRDRRPEGFHRVDRLTGLPESANDLAGNAQALRKDALALQWPVNPYQWARVHMGLWAHPPETWDPQARRAVEITEERLKNLLCRLEERGLVDTNPDMGMGEVGDDKDGLPMVARFTPAGLAHAKAIIPGTPFANGPISCAADVPEDQRHLLPAWVQSEWRAESGA